MIATVYAALGDRDSANAWLDRAYESRSWYITWLNVHPDFDGMRADPRCVDLVKRAGVLPKRN